MRPFLLLGDITGSLAFLGLAALAFAAFLVFGGIKLQRTNATARVSQGIGCVVLTGGLLVGLFALSFLYDLLPGQQTRQRQRQLGEAEAARQNTSWKAKARQSQQELNHFEQSFAKPTHELPDSSWRHRLRQDSMARARAEKSPVELEW